MTKTFNEEATVASLELCKELYELTRGTWKGEPSDCVSSSCTHHAFYDNGTFVAPKYDAGYLLSKLPNEVKFNNLRLVMNSTERRWRAGYGDQPNMQEFADTPENALAKLAIELFKSGVLERTPKIYEKGKKL